MKTWSTALLALLLLVVVASCNGTTPSVSEWEKDWHALTAVIPPVGQLANEPRADTCDQALAQVRERSAEILPSPSLTTDDLIREWISVAESIFFTCPEPSADPNFYADSYSKLDELESLIAASYNQSSE